MKGSYVLLLHLPQALAVTVGRLGDLHLPRGHYAYVGSAMRGFGTRVNRYLKPAGKRHWHIDYLRERASVSGIILCPTEHRTECAIAQSLGEQLECIPDFGASDCHCRSHLFWAENEVKLKRATAETTKRLKPDTELLEPPEVSARLDRL